LTEGTVVPTENEKPEVQPWEQKYDLANNESSLVRDEAADNKKRKNKNHSKPKTKRKPEVVDANAGDFMPGEHAKGAAKKINPYAIMWGQSRRVQLAGVVFLYFFFSSTGWVMFAVAVVSEVPEGADD
jgi:hypothetical protein